MDGIHCSQFTFYNDFDSSNLSKVEFVPQRESAVTRQNSNTINSKSLLVEVADAEFNIWTRPDCHGTEFENGNRTWFYFGVKAPRPGLLVRFNLVDLNRQGKMYSQGMAPVYRIIPGKPKWDRIQDKPFYNLNEDIFTLSFKYRSPESHDSCTYFAFTYPFSYVELQKMLVNIDAKYLTMQPLCEDDIYYVRETACRSLEGRNIDLITVTSYHGITIEREERLRNLFPDKDLPRPHKFLGKKVIFVSARVHPGETPSSFVFNGLLNLLLSRDDLQAQQLRRLYVFKLVPFLNPDGVARGHYRTDTRGVNLNRIYLDPTFAHHPSVYAARALIRYYHFGFEKEDKVPRCDSCERQSGQEVERSSENANVSKMSTMSINEAEQAELPATSWCTKCKSHIVELEKTMQGISTLVPTFNHHFVRSLGHNFCRQCGRQLEHSVSKEEVRFEEAKGGESGLFLYLDLHGHASKKGIFMYGNHFDDIERRVECMLLPKLMALNSHHFHFPACNFTERNMYLKDKRDGMSRAGSGRVAVLSLTGIIKSYTLECNYNTGRLVNVLPPAVKEAGNKAHTLPVPPKYTPQIFEEVGRSLGASILDLTGQNPFSRLPNSEFHNLSGLRDWLHSSCGFGGVDASQRPKMSRMRPPNVAQLQGKGRCIKGRPPLTRTIKKATKKTAPVERKENLVSCQPSCSKSSVKMGRPFKAKSRKELSLKTKNATTNTEKTSRTSKKQPLVKEEASEVHLREICFIKSTEGGKTMIAKYKSKEGGSGADEEFDDNLVVSWDAPNARPTVFTHKARALSAPAFAAPSKVGGAAGVFRVHNFAKNSALKSKLKKQALRRLSSAADLGKVEKKKKKKLRGVK